MQSSGSASVALHVVNNRGVVTLKQRLHEKASGADDTHTDEDPQEKTVDHHRHIFPVFNNLQGKGKIHKCPELNDLASSWDVVTIISKMIQFLNFWIQFFITPQHTHDIIKVFIIKSHV